MHLQNMFRKPWLILASSVLLHAGLARKYNKDNDYKDDSKACNKWYPSPVENICHENFPDKTSEKTWIMLFSSHACPDCKMVEKGFVDWASKLRKDPGVRVGVVNCYYAKNYRELCYPRHKIDALPSLRIIEKGEFKEDGKPKHHMQDIDSMINGALSSSSCPEVRLQNSPVVPLCEKHFPGRGTLSTWMVLYYTKSTADFVLELARQVAVELGNVESAVLTEEEKKWQRLKKTDRLLEIKKKYNLGFALPKTGPLGSGALVYVGAICCDCNATAFLGDAGFCKEVMGGYTGALPALGWSRNGEQKHIECMVKQPWALIEYALMNLGLAPPDYLMTRRQEM